MPVLFFNGRRGHWPPKGCQCPRLPAWRPWARTGTDFFTSPGRTGNSTYQYPESTFHVSYQSFIWYIMPTTHILETGRENSYHTHSLTYCFLHKSCLKTSKRQTIMVGVGLLCNNHHSNKCIGDDTKAAARQSLNCIKNQKIKSGEERLLIWRMEFLHPAMWHVALESCQ